MPGVADYECEPTVAKLRAALRVLAQFHAAVEDFDQSAAPDSAGGFNAMQRHLNRVKELSPITINALSREISDSTWPDLAPLARDFLSRLPTAIDRAVARLETLNSAPLPLQPCIKDIWHDHVLFTGNQVTGVVDFGAVDIDTPATDISRLLSSLASLTPRPFREEQGAGSITPTTTQEIWSQGLAAYQESRLLSPAEIAAARALATSGTILAGCNWIRWIYADGRQFENPNRIIDRFRRITQAISAI
jgi:homoserine kinase type II